MSDALRNFIEIPYAELEERNLAAKDQRKRHVPAETDPRRAAEIPHRRKAHQGGHRALQRP